jgi:hypothetical protein
MKSKTYNGEVGSSEKDFETLQLGAFATPGLLLAQGPVCLTAESGINQNPKKFQSDESESGLFGTFWCSFLVI